MKVEKQLQDKIWSTHHIECKKCKRVDTETQYFYCDMDELLEKLWWRGWRIANGDSVCPTCNGFTALNN